MHRKLLIALIFLCLLAVAAPATAQEPAYSLYLPLLADAPACRYDYTLYNPRLPWGLAGDVCRVEVDGIGLEPGERAADYGLTADYPTLSRSDCDPRFCSATAVRVYTWQ